MSHTRVWMIGAIFAVFACGDDETNTSVGGSSGSSSTTATTTTTAGSGSSTTDATTTDGSTGGAGVCGDGTMDPGEECDDGDLEDGDACSSTCMLLFEVEWTRSEDGAVSGDDGASGVIIDQAGSIYVVGTTDTATGRDLFVRQFSPDGADGWIFTYDGAAGLNDGGTDLVFHSSGDIIVVGNEEVAVDNVDYLVLRLAIADQTVVWSRTVDGPGTLMNENDFASGVAVAANGDIATVGTVRTDTQANDIYVELRDEMGTVIWSDTYNGPADRGDNGRSVAVDAAGNVYAMGLERIAPQQDQGWVRQYSPAGMENWTQNPGWIIRDLALDPDENIVITGWEAPGSTIDVRVTKYDPAFMEMWTSFFADAGTDVGSQVFVDTAGDVYVAGITGVVGQSDNLWVGKFAADGSPVWSDSYNNDRANLNEFGNGVAADIGGAVTVVGSEIVLGQGSNTWVRRYTQL